LTHLEEKIVGVRAREKKDQESEPQRDEFFNKLRPMVPRQQWRAKAVSEALNETRVGAVEEQGVTDAEVLVETEINQSDRHSAPVGEGTAQDRSDRPITLVRPVNEGSVQTGAEVPVFSQSCSEVSTPADDKEMLDYEQTGAEQFLRLRLPCLDVLFLFFQQLFLTMFRYQRSSTMMLSLSYCHQQ
jgi:hypothetical protein